MPKNLWAAFVTALLLLALIPGASAAPSEPEGFERLSLEGVDRELVPALADPDRMLTVMVEMEGSPVAVREARAQKAGEVLTQGEQAQARRALRAQQGSIRTDIEALGGTVLSQMQDAYNGMRVRVPASRIRQLAALPNVKAVRDVPTFETTNVQSVPFLGTPAVWQELGLTGQDVSIAVIDTGIDYLHANFGGSGDPADFVNNDPTVIEPDTFPTAKVAGGTDFVGDDYDASSDDPALNTPQPDPDPLDCNGHGSHVAGTAAGMGVLEDGSTYTGPYDETTHDRSFNVGPGVAPQATLYALKVFGCAGSSDVVAEAIDWAVERDIDVINMSLGSPFGRPDDPTAVAAANAARAGVIVVSAAGNDGDAPYIHGSPASAPGTLSVAAMDAIPTVKFANFSSPAGDELLQNSNGADVTEPITGNVRVLEDDPATDADESLGCDAEDYSDVQEGEIVVTFRGVCDRVFRAQFGQEAGAAAVIFINNTDGYPPVEGPIPGVRIPFLGATPDQADTLVASDGQQATITDAGEQPNPTFRMFAGFTSGGPRFGDSGMKPDVTAPGVGIQSTFVGSGNAGIPFSGTSMASPHVAGVAALVRQARPDWDVPAVNAAITNTADPAELVDYTTRVGGAGLVQPAGAVSSPVVATGNEGTGALSFGYRQASGMFSLREQITLHNAGDDDVAFVPSVEWSENPQDAASLRFRPNGAVTVPADGTRTVRAILTVDSAQVPADFVTASGNVRFTPVEPVGIGNGLTALRVPFMAVPDAASSLVTRPGQFNLRSDDDTVAFRTVNRSPVPGTVDVYGWGLRDPRGESDTTDVRAVGVQAFADSDIGVFAINTFNRLSNPAVNEWDVLLDVDEDGTFDYAVVGFDIGAVLAGAFNGILGSFTVDLETFQIVDAFFAGGGFDTSHVLLPFALSTVGLSPDNGDFEYVSAVFSLEGFPGDFVDGIASFDAFQQPVETGAFFEVSANEQVAWEATVDPEAVAAHEVRGFMVVYGNNRNGGQRAQLIPVRVR